MLREGKLPACFDTPFGRNTAPSCADLKLWWAKLRDEQLFSDTV
jgi:hypothetical protein